MPTGGSSGGQGWSPSPPLLPHAEGSNHSPLPALGVVPTQGVLPEPRFPAAPCLGRRGAADLELAQTAHHEGEFHLGHPRGKRQQPPVLWEADSVLSFEKGFLFCLHFYN